MTLSSPTLPVLLKQYQPAILLWLAAMTLAAQPCSAQATRTVEFSPLIGAYVPTAQLPGEPIGCWAVAGLSCRSSRQQNSAIALGGRASVWVGKGIALEGSLWYSPSTITGEISTSLNGALLSRETSEGPAGVVATNVRLLVSLTRGAGSWAYVVGGPALVSRFGDAHADFPGIARFGGMVGAGAHLRVARSLAIRAEVEQYLYSVQGYHQQDFVLSVGLSVASRVVSAPTP